MDYAYLNQAAAAGFDASSCSLGGSLGGSMDASHVPYTYGDLTSCSQMPSAYRYTGAGMRGYNTGVGVGVGVASQQCGVMGRPQDHRAMFPASVTPVNLQSKSSFRLLLLMSRCYCYYYCCSSPFISSPHYIQEALCSYSVGRVFVYTVSF